MFAIEYSREAVRALARMPRPAAERIRSKIEALATDPDAPNNNVKKLIDRPGFRLRVGDWRVIYEIERDRVVILVLTVAPRGGAYR
jgi:mRNA interferase RelE/StbE